MKDIKSQLVCAGENIDEKEFKSIVLNSFTEACEGTIETLSVSASTWDFEKILGYLLQKEQIMQNRKETKFEEEKARVVFTKILVQMEIQIKT